MRDLRYYFIDFSEFIGYFAVDKRGVYIHYNMLFSCLKYRVTLGLREVALNIY